MNKKGHLLITKKCMEKSLAGEFKGYRIWVMLGSIMPDFLYHTYLMGHTWNATFERTMKRLESLREWGDHENSIFYRHLLSGNQRRGKYPVKASSISGEKRN